MPIWQPQRPVGCHIGRWHLLLLLSLRYSEPPHWPPEPCSLSKWPEEPMTSARTTQQCCWPTLEASKRTLPIECNIRVCDAFFWQFLIRTCRSKQIIPKPHPVNAPTKWTSSAAIDVSGKQDAMENPPQLNHPMYKAILKLEGHSMNLEQV